MYKCKSFNVESQGFFFIFCLELLVECIFICLYLLNYVFFSSLWLCLSCPSQGAPFTAANPSSFQLRACVIISMCVKNLIPE